MHLIGEGRVFSHLLEALAFELSELLHFSGRKRPESQQKPPDVVVFLMIKFRVCNGNCNCCGDRDYTVDYHSK